MVSQARFAVGVGLGFVLLQACSMFTQPGAITNFLTAGNRKLQDALRRGAADWAQHGLEIANYVTVDDDAGGLAVLFADASELRRGCPEDMPEDQIGCTHWSHGDWMQMLIRRDVEADPVLLAYIVQHEMIHALVPKAPHLPDGVRGIFSRSRTTNHVTRADMEHLARFTTVTENQAPFAS